MASCIEVWLCYANFPTRMSHLILIKLSLDNVMIYWKTLLLMAKTNAVWYYHINFVKVHLSNTHQSSVTNWNIAGYIFLSRIQDLSFETARICNCKLPDSIVEMCNEGVANFKVCGQNPILWSYKWNLFSSSVIWHHFFSHCFYIIEIWDFSCYFEFGLRFQRILYRSKIKQNMTQRVPFIY